LYAFQGRFPKEVVERLEEALRLLDELRFERNDDFISIQFWRFEKVPFKSL